MNSSPLTDPGRRLGHRSDIAGSIIGDFLCRGLSMVMSDRLLVGQPTSFAPSGGEFYAILDNGVLFIGTVITVSTDGHN